ncbi:MAG TPA: TIGR00730 family Rossman fold protein [Methylomirabilota bacterium]|nr:TIGR00730 family Rossman fold protein [Methylomirabilota bacterium]
MGLSKVSLASIEAQVVEWLQTQSGYDNDNERLIGEMLRTVLKLAQDGANRGDLKILNRALKELRQGFKVFAPYGSVRKVSIFGSTRIDENDPYYLSAKSLGRRLAEEGLMVITGAGPGVMQAGHEGAGREKSFGVNIRLPSIQKANRFIRGDPKLMNFHFFFTRKLMFVKEADAVIIFPGGFGTHDELAEALTLAQTGKSQLVPIILMDLPGSSYWKDWQAFLREAMLNRGYITEKELALFTIVNDADAAVREIQTFYRHYHSYRFVKHDLIIRLNHPPAPGLIDRLNREFADILLGGEVKETAPLPEESEDAETLHLHRLMFHFNREDFARLRQMIDVINRVE